MTSVRPSPESAPAGVASDENTWKSAPPASSACPSSVHTPNRVSPSALVDAFNAVFLALPAPAISAPSISDAVTTPACAASPAATVPSSSSGAMDSRFAAPPNPSG